MLTVLVSVFDKTGLVDFLNELKAHDELRIVATTSTATYLGQNGFPCHKVEELTEFPEILEGRVKTLHPQIFGGILARANAKDEKCLHEFGIWKIDFVIVNLYPFEDKLKQKLSQPEMIEFIDVGGVSLLRAAAKNFERVSVLSRPEQYESVKAALKENKAITREHRVELAQEAFVRTSSYDQSIAAYLSNAEGSSNGSQKSLPQAFNLSFTQFRPLRYGENPHQSAVWYKSTATEVKEKHEDFPPFVQLQGKDLSSNNITDTYCLTKILQELGHPAACIIKHNNPCGVAVGDTLDKAFDKAYGTDPLAAFGGIYGFSDPVTSDLANKIVQGFVEIVAAPDFEKEALDIFNKKKNMRVLKLKQLALHKNGQRAWRLRDLQDFGFILEQDNEPIIPVDQFQVVAGNKLAPSELSDCAFAWSVVKHLTSNAIFIAKDGCSFGFGIGQTSRIASVEIALKQAGNHAQGAVLASDAFFPAIDNIEACAKAGIKTIVQPGGSLKDQDVIEACKKANITMLFSGQRFFKH